MEKKYSRWKPATLGMLTAIRIVTANVIIMVRFRLLLSESWDEVSLKSREKPNRFEDKIELSKSIKLVSTGDASNCFNQKGGGGPFPSSLR